MEQQFDRNYPETWSVLLEAQCCPHRTEMQKNDSSEYNEDNYCLKNKLSLLLLKDPTEVRDKIKFNSTPLHSAVLKNHLKCAERLLQNGPDINSYEAKICHPLHIAVLINCNVEMTALLLDYGADVNLRFNTELFQIFEEPIELDLWYEEDLTLLHYSILKKNNKMTKLLLEHGADVNYLTSRMKKTTLMQAVEVNDDDMVKFLILEKNANVNDRDNDGKSVLHYTICNANTKESIHSRKDRRFRNEKLNIVRYLVEAGADVNTRIPEEFDEDTVVHRMIKAGYTEIVTFLLFNTNFNIDQIKFDTIYNLEVQYDFSMYIYDDFNEKCLVDDIKKNMKEIIIIMVKYSICMHYMGLPFLKELCSLDPVYFFYLFTDEDRQLLIITELMELYRKVMNNLQQTKIDGTNISYWHLLTCEKNEFTKLIAREDILDLDEIYKNKFFLYYDILRKRLRCANEKKLLLEKFTKMISYFTKDQLPYDCCLAVAGFFNYTELKAFNFIATHAFKSC